MIFVAYAILANTNEQLRVRNMNNVFLHTCRLDWVSIVVSVLVSATAIKTLLRPTIILLCAKIRYITRAMIMAKLAISLYGSAKMMLLGGAFIPSRAI